MSANKYQSPIERNNAFMAKVEDLVREIVILNNIPFYRIESRMDHNPNAAEGQTYMPVIRIITYFEDSVDPIAAVLRSEFDVEVEEPVRDKQIIKVDSFSSKHIEYKVTLKANRLELIEYKRYGTKQFEIQACSMIQDAWNCIEKELGYSGGTIPDEARRDFYRVGAILEMADIEFLKIRGLLHQKPAEYFAASEPEEEHFSALKMHVEPVITQEETAVTNIFNLQPEPYQPEPVVKQAVVIQEPVVQQPVVQQPAVEQPVMQQPVVQQPIMQRPAPAQQVYTVVNGIAPQKVSASNTNGMANAASMNGNQAFDMNLNNNIVQDIVSEVANIYSVPEQPKPSAPPVPPVVEKQADPVNLNIDNVPQFNMNGNGMAEKTTETIREQAPVQFYDTPRKNNPPVIDENAQMTDASLKEYVRNSKLLKEIDTQIATRASARLNDEIDIEGDVERLRFLKVHSLKMLHERLADNKNDIIAFAEKWIGKDNGGSFDMGISLFYLEYLLVGKRNDPGFAVEYVLKFISDNDYSARYIIPTYNSIRQSADSSISKFSHLTLK